LFRSSRDKPKAWENSPGDRGKNVGFGSRADFCHSELHGSAFGLKLREQRTGGPNAISHQFKTGRSLISLTSLRIGGATDGECYSKNSISAELAQKMVDAALAKANAIGVAANVAILDDGGNLKAFSRMDGAPILSIEIAQNKAYAALFGLPTQDFFNFIQGEPSLLAGVPQAARVAAYGGGFPVKVDGAIVGAIGVSGGTMQNDIDCAEAALGVLK
jgi:uncharacterized protein GlcG (DUF336 family)